MPNALEQASISVQTSEEISTDTPTEEQEQQQLAGASTAQQEQPQEIQSLLTEIVESKDQPQTVEEKVTEQAGLSISAIEAEMAANDGSISDDTQSKLVEALTSGGFGLSEEEAASTIKNYFEGQANTAKVLEIELYKDIGGKDKFQEAINWAQSALTEKEIDSLNASIDKAGQDFDSLKTVVDSLQAKFEARNGSQRRTIEGGLSLVPSANDAITSEYELTQAMSDPEYLKGNPKVVADVERRAAAGMAAGHI